MQTGRKFSFDFDETTKESFEAGGTDVLQVQQKGLLIVTVQDRAKTHVLQMR